MNPITILSIVLIYTAPILSHAQSAETTVQHEVRHVSQDSNGCYHGIIHQFYRNGNLKQSITYRHGYVYGEAKYFYRSGELKRSGFLDGTNSQTLHWFKWRPSKYGVWIKWHKDGTQDSELYLFEILPQAHIPVSNTICK